MKMYTNSGQEMATVVFKDGDGIILKRGERKRDPREVRWIDESVRVTEARQVVAAEAETQKKSNKKGDKS